MLEVIEHPHQVLLRISFNNKEALIPVHEETLERIDKRKKQVHLDTAGWITGYLQVGNNIYH